MLFPRLRRLSRVQSDSPRGLHGNPRKNLSILSLDSSERELFQESLGPFPLLSYPRRIFLVFAKEKLFPLPQAYLTPVRLSRAVESRKKRDGKEKEDDEEGEEEEREAERGSAVKRGLFR